MNPAGAVVLFAFVILVTVKPSEEIAARRKNAIEDRPLLVRGGSTSGELCKRGKTMTVYPEEAGYAVRMTWPLGGDFILHEIGVTFEKEADAKAAKVIAKIGYADSRFYTKYAVFKSAKKLILRPQCFEDSQWGASGSDLVVELVLPGPVKLECIHAMGVPYGGQNVFIGKPIKSGHHKCSEGVFLMNDAFGDAFMKLTHPPYELTADIGGNKVLKRLEVDTQGEWVNGEISLWKGYDHVKTVSDCLQPRTHRYRCDLNGVEARYLKLRGSDGLSNFREIRLIE